MPHNLSESLNNDNIREGYEQSVIVFFHYGIEELDPLHELEEELRQTVDKAGAGILDGHLIAMDSTHGFLYLYGPDAEVLFKTVLPILEKTPFMKGAVATLKFGPPGRDAPQIDVEITVCDRQTDRQLRKILWKNSPSPPLPSCFQPSR